MGRSLCMKGSGWSLSARSVSRGRLRGGTQPDNMHQQKCSTIGKTLHHLSVPPLTPPPAGKTTNSSRYHRNSQHRARCVKPRHSSSTSKTSKSNTRVTRESTSSYGTPSPLTLPPPTDPFLGRHQILSPGNHRTQDGRHRKGT